MWETLEKEDRQGEDTDASEEATTFCLCVCPSAEVYDTYPHVLSGGFTTSGQHADWQCDV